MASHSIVSGHSSSSMPGSSAPAASSPARSGWAPACAASVTVSPRSVVSVAPLRSTSKTWPVYCTILAFSAVPA